MPQFVVFAIAASMCVLCFAVGFIAALVLRIAQHSAAHDGNPSEVHAAIPAATEPQPAVAEAGAAVSRQLSISLPRVETAERQHNAPRPAATAPAPHPTHLVRSGGFPAPMASAAAKVYLFGDPQLEAVVMPSFDQAAATPGTAWAADSATGTRLAPAEIDLLPRRTQHARPARRR